MYINLYVNVNYICLFAVGCVVCQPVMINNYFYCVIVISVFIYLHYVDS